MRVHRSVALTILFLFGTAIAAQGQERGQAEKPAIGQLPGPVQGQDLIQQPSVRQRPSPRLVVDYIAHTPAPAMEGQSIAIEIKVENEGTAPSSGEETLHYDCKNVQVGGPACPFGASQQTLPVLHPPPAPYATGPQTHSVQLLTVPSWKAGTYDMQAWIEVPGQKRRSEIATATLQVKSKTAQIHPEIAAKMPSGLEDQDAVAAPRAPLPVPVPSGPRLPDLVPELALSGGGILFPLQLLVMNESSAASPASRARVTWQLTCHSADGSASKAFPVGPQDKVYSVPAIGPQQFYNVPGLSGPNQYCKAPASAADKYPICNEHCEVRAVVDPDGVVTEASETNNAAMAEVERLQ